MTVDLIRVIWRDAQPMRFILAIVLASTAVSCSREGANGGTAPATPAAPSAASAAATDPRKYLLERVTTRRWRSCMQTGSNRCR